MQTWVRRQQPLRITGAWTKTFQLLLVSQYAPLFSQTSHSQGTNVVTNSSFETNTSGWGTTASARIATGATLTRVTSQQEEGTASCRVVTTATANEGADFTGISVVSGKTYTATAYARGNAGGETVNLMVGDGTVNSANVSATLSSSAWTKLQVSFTATATGTTGVAVRNTPASVVTFFIDSVSVVHGSAQASQNQSSTTWCENVGNFTAMPNLVIYGPSTGTIQAVNNTTGNDFQALSGMTLSSGQYVTIDCLNHTATRDNGTNFNQYIDFVNSSWPGLVLGYNEFTINNAPAMDVIWRDQWV
jgi:hypothetical protein